MTVWLNDKQVNIPWIGIQMTVFGRTPKTKRTRKVPPCWLSLTRTGYGTARRPLWSLCHRYWHLCICLCMSECLYVSYRFANTQQRTKKLSSPFACLLFFLAMILTTITTVVAETTVALCTKLMTYCVNEYTSVRLPLVVPLLHVHVHGNTLTCAGSSTCQQRRRQKEKK